MNIDIHILKSAGSLSDERLVMEVTADLNVGHYAVFRTTYRNGAPTIKVHDTFWFPDKKAAQGDLVILYTRAGNQHEVEMDNGLMAHFFFWGKNFPIWDQQDKCPVLVNTPAWKSLDPPDVDST